MLPAREKTGEIIMLANFGLQRIIIIIIPKPPGDFTPQAAVRESGENERTWAQLGHVLHVLAMHDCE